MTDQKLKGLAERIERLMDERDGIQSDIRDIFTEAKSAGYVPKVLRKAITRKRMDPSKRNEEDAILELYEGALDGKTRKAVTMAAQGATARQIEAETGIDHATVARPVALNKRSATPHDPETGVIIEDAAPQPTPGPASTPQPLSEGGDGIGHQIKDGETGEASQDASPGPLSTAPSADPEREARSVTTPEPDPWIAADEARARLDESKRAKGFA